MDTEQGDEANRTCATCGADCEPEPINEAGLGVRIAFTCPQHGAQAIVDPFRDLR